jgi:hypothetical protein
VDVPPLVGSVFRIGTPDEFAALLWPALVGETGLDLSAISQMNALRAFAASWAECVGTSTSLPIILEKFSAGYATPDPTAAPIEG